MTKTEIANLAMDFLGAEPVADIDGNTNEAKKAARTYETSARYVLTQHPFKEAIAFETVVDEGTDSYTSDNTANVSGDSTLVVSAAIDAETPRTGTLTVTYDTGKTDELDYASWATSTFTLASGVTLPRTYDENDTLTLIPNKSSGEWGRIYDLPSDSLKVLDLNNDPDEGYKVQGAYIYTNAYDETSGVVIRYIKDIRDEVSSLVEYSDQVGEAIAGRMAYTMGPIADKAARLALFLEMLHEAIYIDADESTNQGSRVEKKWTDYR